VCRVEPSRCDPEERNSRRSAPPTVANQRGRCRPARRVIDPHRVGSLWPPTRLTDTDAAAAAATAAADVNVIDEDFNEPDPRPGYTQNPAGPGHRRRHSMGPLGRVPSNF